MDKERKINGDFLENRLLKEFPYTLPDGYFSSLEERVRERTFGHKPDGKWGALFRSFKAAAALAASFLIVFGLGYGAIKLTQNKLAKSSELASISKDSTSVFENEAILDSLAAKYGPQNLYFAMTNAAEEEIEVLEIEDESYIEAVQEYLILKSDSYTSLLADEFDDDNK